MSGEFTYGCWNKFYKRELIERAKVKFAEHVAYEEPLFVYPLYFYVSCMVIMQEALYVSRLNIYGPTFSYLANKNTLWEHAEVQM